MEWRLERVKTAECVRHENFLEDGGGLRLNGLE